MKEEIIENRLIKSGQDFSSEQVEFLRQFIFGLLIKQESWLRAYYTAQRDNGHSIHCNCVICEATDAQRNAEISDNS